MAHIKFQRTISNETSCIGVGLHTGVESKITFKQVSNVLISKITLAFDKEPLYEDFYEKY